MQPIILYSIMTDNAQEYKLDKIIFNYKESLKLQDQLNGNVVISVSGLYGSQAGIEQELHNQTHLKIDLSQFLQISEKGHLIAVRFQKKVIFCLIISQKFFETKPIYEKAIELALFRILQDLTDNIKICHNDSIFNNWYGGDEIPFSPAIVQRQQYNYVEQGDQKIQEYTCRLSSHFSEDIQKQQILHSQNLSPFFTVIERLQIDDQELENIYITFINHMLNQNVQNEQFYQPQNQLIQKQYQSKELLDHLKQTADKIQEIVRNERKNLHSALQNQNQNIIQRIFQTSAKPNLEEIEKKVFQQLNHAKINFIKKRFIVEYQEKVHLQVQSTLQNIITLTEEFVKDNRKVREKLFFDFKNTIKYSIKKVNCKITRGEDKQIESIRISTEQNQQIIFDLDHQACKKQKIKIKEVFWTKEKAEIVVIQTEDYTSLYLRQQNNESFKFLQNYDIQKTKSLVFYFKINQNHLYFFNFNDKQVMKVVISSYGKIDNQMSICEQCIPQQNSYIDIQIQQVAYMSQQKKFIILTKDNEVYFLLEDSKQIIQAMCSSKNNQKLFKFQIKTNPEENQQLLSCPSGKYFYFAQGQQCFIYDMNCQQIRTINIQGKIKIFSDQSDLIILDEIDQITQKKNVIVLANVIQQKTINKLGEEEKQIIGNPAFDILKGSFIKFGPNSVFLSESKKKQISFQIDLSKKNQIETYFNKMNLDNVNLDTKDLQYSEISIQDLQNIIFSRVPLQLCTTENGTLIPLVDGFRQEASIQQQVSVYEKAKQLRLGFIEEYLNNDKSQIFVIGIIGKQSSGKSYLLNRVFGTRFSVSSARCTDGIWASIGWIEGQKFLILDCEGLFNSARTNQEEVQMLAFLTAICDISILNSDITFNRYMNELFNNLTNASSQLKGETLFKGNLHIVLRDVSSNDNSGIDNELLSNLYRLKSSESQDIVFLKKLFNNNFTVEKLFNFEHSKFDEQIINLRQYFSKVAQEDGDKLLQMMKILLCQLELSDHGNAYLIDLKLQIEKIIENQKNFWDKFSTNQQQVLKLNQQKYQFPSGEIIFFNIPLLKQLQDDLQLNDTIMNHNQNLNMMEYEFNNLMTSRKEHILEQTKEQLQRFQKPEMIEIISKEVGLLANYINNQIQQYQFCKEKCSECYLNCNQFKNHIKEYDKLMSKLETKKVALEKEIAESSIQNEDQEQQINQRLVEIIEQLQQQDDQILKFEMIIKKDEEEKKIIRCLQDLSQFEFCDTANNGIKLEVFQESFKKEEIQKANEYLELTVENLDQLFYMIDENSKQQKLQSVKNAEKLEVNINNLAQLQNQLEDVKNTIILNDQNQKQVFVLQDQLYRKEENQNKKIKDIDQELLKLQNNLSYKINLIIDNTNLIKQQEEISSQLSNEQKKLEQLQEQIKIYEQKTQQACQNKLLIYDESDLFEEFQEIKNEKEMILKQVDKLQKQKEKIHKLESIKQEKTNLTVKKQKEKEKYENDLKISIQDDLIKKQFEIESNLQLFQLQLNKQKFEDLEIFEEIKNKQSQNIHSNQLQNIYQQFLHFKKAEEKDLEDELLNLNEQIRKIEQIIKNLEISQQQISEYQNILNFKVEAENFLIENQKELVKINEQNRYIVNEQETLKRKMEEIKIQNDLFNTTNNSLKNENEQIEQALYNIEQQKKQISECLKILYEIDDYKQFKSYELFEECKKFQQLQNSDLNYTKQCQLLKDEKESLLKEKQQLDQRVQAYFQVGEGKQQLKELQKQIEKLKKLQCHVHSCQRQSHICEEKCQACPDKLCNHKAGHDEKQEHLCSKLDHICDMDCSVQDCQNKCKNIRNHGGNHTCNSKHICTETCDYCDKQCQYDKTEIHQKHICQDKNNGCNQECELCDKNCKEQHQHSIKKGSYCEKKCLKFHPHQKQQPGTHLCNDIHYCKETCTKQGICNVEYESVQVKWKSNISEFQYTKYIPKNGGKKKCMHQILKGKYNHDQEHVCMRDTNDQYHFCDQKCPECQSFCELKYDHKGLHYSSKHRNKDDQKFTLQKGNKNQIKVVSEDGKMVKNYVVGDVSSPETCRESCKRRGRSHFHLIECKGGQECLEKTLLKGYARHSKQQYIGFEFQKFDEILCFQFWELKMWAHPLQNTEDIDIIQSCDAYCPLCQNNQSFCEERGWHTQSNKIKDHKFPCSVNHQQDIFHGIDVAFVIDTTGSMSDYIVSCIEIIKKTMQKFQKFKEHLNQCQFAIVSYKDHSFPYDVNQKVVNFQDFASEDVIHQFLQSLQAEGGSDWPEALLDGLNTAIKLNWKDKNVKILYLIADAPPHGNNNKKQRKYHNYKDNFPDGCPCGLDQNTILQKFLELNIQLKIVKINSNLEIMISNFKEDYQNIVELTPQNMDKGYLQISRTQRNYISIQTLTLPVKEY